jgi:hypothetical protein
MNTKKVFPFLAEDLNLISLRGRKFIGCRRSKMKLQVEFPSSNDPSQGWELSLEEQVGPIFILTVFLLSLLKLLNSTQLNLPKEIQKHKRCKRKSYISVVEKR